MARHALIEVTAVVSLCVVAVVATFLASGCGETGAVGSDPSATGPTTAPASSQPPPIDLAAPASFETASFALG